MRALAFALLPSLAASVGLTLAACGGGDDEPGAAAGRAQPEASAAAEGPVRPGDTERQKQVIQELRNALVWKGEGPPSDVDADIATCRREIEEGERPAGPGLGHIAASLKCLKEKGWEPDPDRS